MDYSDRPIQTGVVVSANVFCCSWGSLVVAILLCCSWFGVSLETIDWVLLGVFSSAFVASSMLFYEEETFIERNDASIGGRICDVLDVLSCARIRFGQYLGIASALISVTVAVLLQKIPGPVRLVSGGLLFVVWSCAAALVTFGKGYGANAGSIYLEVWSAFFLSLDIMNAHIIALLLQWYEGEGGEDGPPNSDDGNGQDEQGQRIVNDLNDHTAISHDRCTVELPDSEE